MSKRIIKNEMIKTDCHLHSTFSTDGSSEMEHEIRHAISLGIKTLCFTEHDDYGAYADGSFVVDMEAYSRRLLELKNKYASDIEILFGLEVGMQPVAEVYEHFAKLLPKWNFDFIIGSSHVVKNKDPYYPVFFEDYPDEDAAYRAYFEEELADSRMFDDFDSFGHLDYIFRYDTSGNKDFTYSKFADYIEPLLEEIIKKGKCIEVNSAGLRKGMKQPNPHTDIIKRYKELGGLPPTIGSDAHNLKDIAADFDIVEKILRDAGYSTYSIFRKRERSEISL